MNKTFQLAPFCFHLTVYCLLHKFHFKAVQIIDRDTAQFMKRETLPPLEQK